VEKSKLKVTYRSPMVKNSLPFFVESRLTKHRLNHFHFLCRWRNNHVLTLSRLVMPTASQKSLWVNSFTFAQNQAMKWFNTRISQRYYYRHTAVQSEQNWLKDLTISRVLAQLFANKICWKTCPCAFCQRLLMITVASSTLIVLFNIKGEGRTVHICTFAGICEPEFQTIMYTVHVLATTLTEYSNKYILTSRTLNAVTSGTSVASFGFFSDGQRKGDNTVIRESCPGEFWRWMTICCTVEYHVIILDHCLVIRDMSNVWWNWKVIIINSETLNVRLSDTVSPSFPVRSPEKWVMAGRTRRRERGRFLPCLRLSIYQMPGKLPNASLSAVLYLSSY